jgi:hypothetical protein
MCSPAVIIIIIIINIIVVVVTIIVIINIRNNVSQLRDCDQIKKSGARGSWVIIDCYVAHNQAPAVATG